MTRKLAMLLLAAALGLGHGTAHALGLGEIAVESALDQPFEARIQLRNVGSLEPNEVIVNLASSEDFERVGVERFFFLSGLEFETDLSDPDGPMVHVTSDRPITEPFVNFVVEVLWPSGRLLREYTVLLDPPTYGEGSGSPAQAPSVSTGSPAAASRPDRASSQAPAAATAADSRPVADDGQGRFEGGEYGVTGRNDTLWAIAAEVRPNEVSVQQTMLALVRTNPEAFIGGNINQLKAGYVLRVPGRDEIERLSFRDAVVQVAEHNERWRKGLDRAPLDARDDAAAGSGSTGGGELRLVAGDSGSTESAGSGSSAAGTTGSSGGADPAALREARSRLESAEAANEDLESRLEQTRTRIDELERELELKNEQLARAQQALKAELKADSATPATQPGPDRASGSGLFGLSWMMIGALPAALAVLGGLALMLTRRRGAEVDPAAETDVDADVERTRLMPAISSEELGDTAGERGDDSGEDDAIGEADVYMVYGRFSEAARVLSSAIEADPGRSDIRLKLLEVYAESGDVEGFNQQIRELAGVADSRTVETADRIAARLPGAVTSAGEVTEGDASAPARETAEGEMSLDFDLAADGEDEVPGADLDSLDIDLEPEAAAGGDSGAEPDFDLDLDDEGRKGEAAEPGLLDDDDRGLSIDGDEPATKSDAGGSVRGEDTGDLPDLDFALDLDGDDQATREPETASAGTAEGDDDLDLDLDFELPGESETGGDKAAGEGGDDFTRTMVMDSGAVKSALAESGAEEKDSAPADDDPGDFEFDLDELADTEQDPLAAGPAGRSGEEAAGPEAPVTDESAELEDLEFDLDDLADTSGPADDEDDGSLSLADLEADSDGDALLGLGEESTPVSPGESGDDRTLLSAEGDDLDFDLNGDDFDFGSDDADEISTRLELARAYVDMGDDDGAREILDEVFREGDDAQKQDAEELLSKLS